MDARTLRATLVAALACCSLGASHRTQNFIVNAPTKPVAEQVGDAAERYRRDLAIDWFGEDMPPWSQPCPITVQVGERLGAGGATSFVFDRGEVFGWQMTIQGSLERILDSVLPHEVTHTLFASHFRRPLPRWADEGACTTVEHPSERTKQQQMLIQFLKTGRGIPFSAMFAMKEYPADVLPLYAQGHSLAGFLLAQGGKRKFLQFVDDGLQNENWTAVVARHYGYQDLRVLQNSWLDWVGRGSPPLLATGTEPDAKTASAVLPTSAPAGQIAGQVAPTGGARPAPYAVAVNAPAGNVTAPAMTISAATPRPTGGPTMTPPPPLNDGLSRWVAAEQSSRHRNRPQPNLMHHESVVASKSPTPSPNRAAVGPTLETLDTGKLVPVTLPQPPSAAAPPLDPFAAAQAGGAYRSGASRPQEPQTVGQIVLEWNRPSEPAIPVGSPAAYSSGLPTPPTGLPMSSGLPMFDAGMGGPTIRR